MSKIKEATIYQILSGHGDKTLAVRLSLADGATIGASVPLKIKNDLPLEQALKDFNEQLKPWLLDLSLHDSVLLADEEINNLWQEHKISSASLSLVVSLALNRAAAFVAKQPLYAYLNQSYNFEQSVFTLPTPLINLFNGGRQGDTNLDWEEFLFVPLSKNSSSFQEKIWQAQKLYNNLGRILAKAGFDTDVGGFGGYAPDLSSSRQAVDFIIQAANEAGLVWGEDAGLGLDLGAAWIYQTSGRYLFKLDRSEVRSLDLIQLYEEWHNQEHLVYVEDPLAPSDASGWQELHKRLGQNLIVAGDDFLGTEDKLRRDFKNHLANTVVLRLDSVATVKELAERLLLAREHNYQIVLSGSDFETNDSFLADLAVASGADFIKPGSVARGERVAKINRLLEIEQEIVN